MDRRSFLAAPLALALARAAGAAPSPHLRRPKTRLILLGTGGGPRPRASNAASSQVVIADDVAYVVDCGDGVARQLVLAGVPLATIRHVFFTHQHSDHNADYGNLLLLAWTAGLRTRVDTWGPPPLAAMTRLFFEMSDSDISTRIADEGRAPLVPLVQVHEVTEAGPVMRDARVRVTAALVPHPLVAPAFAYRFDAPDRSIVISGDTAVSDAMVRLARGADVLVHEAMYGPAVDPLVARAPPGGHAEASPPGEPHPGRRCRPRGAARRVKLLVLSHRVPPDDPAVTESMWIEAARTHFRGRIVLGKDLLEI